MAHPLAGLHVTAGFVMVFGPRTEDEVDVVAGDRRDQPRLGPW